MFEDAEPVLERILVLVAKCPEALQGKCFEILLNTYVQGVHPPAEKPGRFEPEFTGERDRHNVDRRQPEIPESIRSRFSAFASRLKVSQEELAGLFDFHSDPFTYHAVEVPGASKAQKTRNVALLLAVKTYLSAGTWTADWKEFRAMCVAQNCYDRQHNAEYLNSAKEGYFTTATEQGITLSPAGIRAAQALVSSMVRPKANNGTVK
jgi:hypothetical protein